MISETTVTTLSPVRKNSSSRHFVGNEDDDILFIEAVEMLDSTKNSGASEGVVALDQNTLIKPAPMESTQMLPTEGGHKRPCPGESVEPCGKRPREATPPNSQDFSISQQARFPRAFNKNRQKPTRDNDDILLIIPDYLLLVQAVQIATPIADQLQFTVCWGNGVQYIEFRGMHPSLVTCYQAIWAVQVEKPIIEPPAGEIVKRTFFLQASTFASALQSKGARNIGSVGYILHMLISPEKNKIKLSFRSNKPSANGYFAEEQLKLMEGTETDAVCEDVSYPFKIKLRVSDIRAIFQSFHDSKEYVDCHISLHTNSRGSYAILLTAESVIRKSKHGFVHHSNSSEDTADAEGGELLFESAEGGSSVADDMELKFVQSFTVAKIYLIVRAMKEQFMFMSLDQHVPLCIRYDLAITSDGFSSYIMCFICPMDDRDDNAIDQDEAPRALPPPMDEAPDSDELLY